MSKKSSPLWSRPHFVRRTFQCAAALLCLYIGWQFYSFLQWTRGAGDPVARPAGVEGFLPISALLSLKRLVLTGQWDQVHPAGLTLLLTFLAMAWLFRKGFCGYVCPVGLISNMLESVGRKLGLAKVPNKWFDFPLRALKYLLLSFFLFTTLFGMSLYSIGQFIRSPYNITADARLMAFFLHPSMLALAVFGALAVLGIVFRNFWCRYLCPYGALLGLASMLSPLGIRRETSMCINCGKCTRTCPAGIDVMNRVAVNSPECIGCAQCVGSCPVPECLEVSAGRKRLPFWVIPLGVVAVFVVGYAWANLAGNWNSTMPMDMLRKLYASVR